jgi:hypothetical protein
VRGTGYFHPIVGQNLVHGPFVTTQSVHDRGLRWFYRMAAKAGRSVLLDPAGGPALPLYGAVGSYGLGGLGESPTALSAGRCSTGECERPQPACHRSVAGVHSGQVEVVRWRICRRADSAYLRRAAGRPVGDCVSEERTTAMDPDRKPPVEYILDPGDLVELVDYGNAPGEVHTVEIGDHDVTYLVRVLGPGVPAHPVGSFISLPHKAVKQIGLQVGKKAWHGEPWEEILHDSRVTKYLDADSRRALGELSSAHVGTEPSIDGVLAVTAPTLELILANRDAGQPPLRPDQGTRGQVTWMVIKGNPEVGAPRPGERRDQPVTVRVFPGVALDQITRIDTAELTRRVALTLRQRWSALAVLATGFVAANQNVDIPKIGIAPVNELQAMAASAVQFAARVPAVNPAASTAVLNGENQQIAQQFKTAFGDNRLCARFVGFITLRQAVHAQMWEALGRYVETVPHGLAIVEFVNSELSRHRDGQYLIVASRGYIYLLQAGQ